MVITVNVRDALVYPADDTASVFATLAGASTFSLRNLVLIKDLGYTVHVASGTMPAGWEL